MAVNFNEQLTKIMQNSVQSVRASADRKRQNIPTAQTKQTGSSAYQRLVAANRQPTTTKQKNSWEFKADGTRKSFNELTTPEVLTWIGTLPEEERGSAARDFETNYLKNPGSTRYDPYYTDYSNNDEARSLFGVNTFDQEWIDANRGYANYLTFSGENYTTPKKAGRKSQRRGKEGLPVVADCQHLRSHDAGGGERIQPPAERDSGDDEDLPEGGRPADGGRNPSEH